MNENKAINHDNNNDTPLLSSSSCHSNLSNGTTRSGRSKSSTSILSSQLCVNMTVRAALNTNDNHHRVVTAQNVLVKANMPTSFSHNVPSDYSYASGDTQSSCSSFCSISTTSFASSTADEEEEEKESISSKENDQKQQEQQQQQQQKQHGKDRSNPLTGEETEKTEEETEEDSSSATTSTDDDSSEEQQHHVAYWVRRTIREASYDDVTSSSSSSSSSEKDDDNITNEKKEQQHQQYRGRILFAQVLKYESNQINNQGVTTEWVITEDCCAIQELPFHLREGGSEHQVQSGASQSSASSSETSSSVSTTSGSSCSIPVDLDLELDIDDIFRITPLSDILHDDKFIYNVIPYDADFFPEDYDENHDTDQLSTLLQLCTPENYILPSTTTSSAADDTAPQLPSHSQQQLPISELVFNTSVVDDDDLSVISSSSSSYTSRQDYITSNDMIEYNSNNYRSQLPSLSSSSYYKDSSIRKWHEEYSTNNKHHKIDSINNPASSALSSATSTSSKKKQKNKNRVTFCSVQVRSYERIIGDHPCCTSGPSLSIGWKYNVDDDDIAANWEINDYEHYRKEYCQRKVQTAPILSKNEREALLKQLGYTQRDMAKSARKIRKSKQQRRTTIARLHIVSTEPKAILTNGSGSISGSSKSIGGSMMQSQQQQQHFHQHYPTSVIEPHVEARKAA